MKKNIEELINEIEMMHKNTKEDYNNTANSAINTAQECHLFDLSMIKRKLKSIIEKE